MSRHIVLGTGGIASKNSEMFKQKIFVDEFTNCCKQHELLKNIPVYVITDYNISLYGAAEFMTSESLCNILTLNN